MQVLRKIAGAHYDLLLWHLSQHKSALAFCIGTIGNCNMIAFDDADAMYTSEEEDYFSEDEEVMMDDPGAELPVSPYSRRPDSSGNFPAISNLIHIAERRARRPA